MLINTERSQLRQFMLQAWRKYLQNQPVEPLEQQIVNIIIEHPEYHTLFANSESVEKNFNATDSSNPFLHIALHLALQEQVNTNRPYGIQAIYQQLCQQTGTRLIAEHLMLNVLAENLWQMHTRSEASNEQAYLEALKSLLK